jgi:hypothetical protein
VARVEEEAVDAVETAAAAGAEAAGNRQRLDEDGPSGSS